MDSPGRLLSVSTILGDLLYLTYSVPSSSIRPLVPALLPLAAVEGNQVFLSIIILKCRKVGPFTFPWLPAGFNQLNIRTYVRHPRTGEIGIFFLTSAITSRPMLVIPSLLNLPLEHAKLNIHTEGTAPGGGRRYRASGFFHGEIFVEGYQTDRALESIKPFANQSEVRTYLTEPTVAFYKRNKRTEVLCASHKHIDLSALQITHFRFSYLTSSGLVDEAKLKATRSALLVRKATFVLYTPKSLNQEI